MRLSNLYTKEVISENLGNTNLIGKAFSKAANMPNPKYIKLDRLINQVYQDLWGSYHDDPNTQAKLAHIRSGYIQKFYPELSEITDRSTLENKIKTLFLNGLGST